MKRSKKITISIIIFFVIIALIIVGRYGIGLYFKKKFSKRPPPGTIVQIVKNENLYSYEAIIGLIGLSVMMLLLIINYSVNLGLSFCKKGSIWYPIIHVFVIILLDIILMFKEGIFKQKKQIYEDPILLNQDEYTTQEEYNVVEEENNF